MPRFFNTAGPCRPGDHYMLPPERRLPTIRRLIEDKLYFVVHAPRQTGKTTSLRTLAQALTAEGRFAALHASCESGAAAGSNIEAGVSAVLRSLERQAEVLPAELRPLPVDHFSTIYAESRLTAYLTRWCERSTLPVVLFLDEIDALIDATLLSVLRQLREGYPDRPDRFPQSLALIGLRDVRDYKIHTRPEATSLGTSSPFNVKVESLTLRNFTAEEVAELYGQHGEETGQVFAPEACERAWELTHGQPWLVNALARQAVEGTLPDRSQPITPDQVEQAKEALILRRDTHLDSLVDRLREPRVQRVIEPILAGELLAPDTLADDLQFCLDLGLVASAPTGLEIANPIYREVIPRALAWVVQDTLPLARTSFLKADGDLDFDRLLTEFRAFWCEHAEHYLERQPYSEAAAQLVFMAYLQRVVNGGGQIEREYGVGRGRIDLHIRWPHRTGTKRWAIELKVRRGTTDPRSAGLEQLGGYLDRLGLDRGTLVIFDARADAPPLPERAGVEVISDRGRMITVMRL
ncbi:MAG: AAA family ATPase [Thermoanaerobaculia bacterium]|nr:AAA family ATPase [Thermoanaerobaculia bacterium]